MTGPMPSWVRREFGAAGVTQYPPGPHLDSVAEHFAACALLCIDVSYSMEGERLEQAVAGGLEFLEEAGRAGYRCGLALWASRLVAYLPPSADPAAVRARLRNAAPAGGTNLLPAVRQAVAEFGPLKGDRVVCVFGDGDVGDADAVEREAARARELGIRVVVRGLGSGSTRSLSRVLTPDLADAPEQVVADVADVRRGIASMASSLRISR